MRSSPAVVAIALVVLALAACARPVPSAAPEAHPTGIALALTPAACATAGADADRDGMDDACELELARAFAPELVVDARDCLWIADGAASRLAGGYLFAVQPVEATVRIAYMPGYFRDCGWTGAACVLRLGQCGAHAGDSELLVVEVVHDAGSRRWRTEGVFLTAHCFGRSDGRCRWYRGRALDEFAWAGDVPRGAPRVWVARGKHGGYPSRAACDGGHWAYDSCDDNAASVRFPVVSAAQNAGSRAAPTLGADGCVASEHLAVGTAGTHAGTSECPWVAARPFRGWQSDGAGHAPTSYARQLALFAGF